MSGPEQPRPRDAPADGGGSAASDPEPGPEPEPGPALQRWMVDWLRVGSWGVVPREVQDALRTDDDVDRYVARAVAALPSYVAELIEERREMELRAEGWRRQAEDERRRVVELERFVASTGEQPNIAYALWLAQKQMETCLYCRHSAAEVLATSAVQQPDASLRERAVRAFYYLIANEHHNRGSPAAWRAQAEREVAALVIPPAVQPDALRQAADGVLEWVEDQTKCGCCEIVNSEHESYCVFGKLHAALAGTAEEQ